MTTNNNNRIPELRFPGFTGEWEERRLGDVCNCFSGGTPKSGEPKYYGGNIPFIRSGEIHSNSTELFLTEEGLDNSSAKLVKKGDLLYALYGATSVEVDISKIDGAINQAILCIRSNSVNLKFLNNFLNCRKEFITSRFLQGGQGNLSSDIIMSLSILLSPTLAEQQKIADCLSSLDEEIAAEAQKADALKDHKKGLMQQLFPQPGQTTPQRRFPGFTGEWVVKKLGEIANLSKGKGIAKSDIDIHGQTTCIRYGELYTRYGEQIKTVFSRTNIPSQDLVLGKVNDVIIPSSGETHEDIATASCILVPGVAIGGDINILRTPLNGLFLSYYLNSAKKHEIAHIAQGDAVVHLYGTQLSKLSICFPPTLAEQQKIADCLSELDEMISAQQQKVEALKEHKKGLMQKLFPKMSN